MSLDPSALGGPEPALVVEVPSHGHEVRPWRQTVRGGTKEDRTLSEVRVALPPTVRDLRPLLPARVTARIAEALREITVLDQQHGHGLSALSTLLLRAESVASSKIEHVEASVDDYARALHGVRANSSAASMVASTRALADLIGSVQGGGPVTLRALLDAHHELMADDPLEARYAGRARDMQNWIGGSDHSPRNALYVPPPPTAVEAYLLDLVAFANRDDVDPLTQAAIAHAQFESIHPFTDGNGRIGRALVNTVLRRRGTTQRVVVPLASALVARRDDYFDTLAAYRSGDAGPIISAFCAASLAAAPESQTTSERLAELPDLWRVQAGRPRRGSATTRLLDGLLESPVFSVQEAETRVGGASSSVYAAIARLAEAEVLRPLTQRTRNQVWIASALADELDDLGVRIAARARER